MTKPADFIVPHGHGTTEFRVTPPRKRTIMCRMGEVVSLNFPWMIWGKCTRDDDPNFFHPFVLCAVEGPITGDTLLSIPFLEGVFQEMVCFGDVPVTKDSDVEELFFQTSFQVNSDELNVNSLFEGTRPGLKKLWSWNYQTIGTFRNLGPLRRPEDRWYSDWLSYMETVREDYDDGED